MKWFVMTVLGLVLFGAVPNVKAEDNDCYSLSVTIKDDCSDPLSGVSVTVCLEEFVGGMWIVPTDGFQDTYTGTTNASGVASWSRLTLVPNRVFRIALISATKTGYTSLGNQAWDSTWFTNGFYMGGPGIQYSNSAGTFYMN